MIGRAQTIHTLDSKASMAACAHNSPEWTKNNIDCNGRKIIILSSNMNTRTTSIVTRRKLIILSSNMKTIRNLMADHHEKITNQLYISSQVIQISRHACSVRKKNIGLLAHGGRLSVWYKRKGTTFIATNSWNKWVIPQTSYIHKSYRSNNKDIHAQFEKNTRLLTHGGHLRIMNKRHNPTFYIFISIVFFCF